MTKQEDFLDHVVQALKKSLKPPDTRMEPGSLCAKYCEKDYERYAIGNDEEMTNKERAALEAHSQECPICREGMAAAIKRGDRECAALVARSLEYLKILESKKPPGLAQIVFKLGRDLIQAIGTAGWRVVQPPVLQTRTPEPVLRRPDVIKVRREVGEPPISVEITAEKGQRESELSVTVSLFKAETETFLTNVQVAATGAGLQEKTTTDKDGLAHIVLPAPGEYNIRINDPANVNVIIHIAVKPWDD